MKLDRNVCDIVNQAKLANQFDYEESLIILNELKKKPITFYGGLDDWLIKAEKRYMDLPDFWETVIRYKTDRLFTNIYCITIIEQYQPPIEYLIENQIQSQYLLTSILIYNLEFPDTDTIIYYYLGINYVYQWGSYKDRLQKNKSSAILPLAEFENDVKDIIIRLDTMYQFDIITGDEYNFIRDYMSAIKAMQYGMLPF